MKTLIYGRKLAEELEAIAHLLATCAHNVTAKTRARAEYAALCAFRAYGLRAVVLRIRCAYLRAYLRA